MDVADAIALYAAVVATGSGVDSWRAWRTVPGSRVEVRDFKVVRREGRLAEITAIAANCSPHEVELHRPLFD